MFSLYFSSYDITLKKYHTCTIIHVLSVWRITIILLGFYSVQLFDFCCVLFCFSITYSIRWIRLSINYKCQWKETYSDAISICTKLHRVFITLRIRTLQWKRVISRCSYSFLYKDVYVSRVVFFNLHLLTILSLLFLFDFLWL